MPLPDLDAAYWKDRYTDGSDRWDAGTITTPLKEYFDQLTDRTLRILTPGAGRAHEAEYLHRLGFANVFVIDLTDAPFADLLKRCPDFPREHLIVGDFFAHSSPVVGGREGIYDRIIEQTFFCALDPQLRPRYVEKMYALLAPGGILAGVLFDDQMNMDKPPFGGNKKLYEALFRERFNTLSLERCYNSISPRAGRELWLRAGKKKS